MRRCNAARLTVLAGLLLTPFAVTRAGTVHGTVMNGTTGKAGAGVEVILIQLQGGMQEVAHAKSGTQGEFSFDHADLGVRPMLVRAAYNGINFNKPVPPGTATVQIDIYEPSRDLKTIDVPSHVVVFQPNGSTLTVGEEYRIENKSQPPLAYFKSDGNFDFALPQNAKLQQVAAAGPAGMPVVQSPIDKKNNRYSIAFAFRPGDNQVRYSYELPYNGNAATVKIPTIYPGGSLLVVAPPTVQVSGDGLAPGGQEQGMSLYGRQDVPAGTLVSVSLSGTAPPQDANAGADQGAQGGRDAQQGGGESGGVTIQQVPGRLDDLKWPLIGVFVVAFVVGAILLSRKQVVVAEGIGAIDESSPAQATPKPKKAKPSDAAPTKAATAPAPAPTNGASSMAEVDAAIGTSLDGLKERLFKLELRRQAGTISEEEYAQERARAEKVLRDLVRG
jgi:hypothetical protein